MTRSASRTRWSGPALRSSAITIALALSSGPACADVPMTYLRAFGPKGERIAELTWALLILSIVVIVVISALVIVGVVIRRARPTSHDVGVPETSRPIVETSSGASWIYVGVGLTIVALFGAMVWNGYTMAAIHRPAHAPRLSIEVVGHQWWWQVRYLSQDSSRVFDTANEIHIPVGEPVEFKVRTSDVIHSFWIPPLGDKIDLIPNQTNVTWLEASKPGAYRGTCAEFCGPQHAHMALVVIADEPAVFQEWMNAQLQPAATSGDALLTAGAARFMVRCGGCHTVRGTPAGGRLGPDLTHLMSRRALAAETLPNTAAYLSGWIADPQAVKPGNWLPTLDISGRELADIRSFLERLE
jgi:cytochrome c oxidase subunit 2